MQEKFYRISSRHIVFLLIVYILCIKTIVCAFEVNATLTIDPTDTGYEAYVMNNEPFDVYLVLDFPVLEGLSSETELPKIIVIASGINEKAYTLTTIQGSRRIGYRLQYNFLFADPTHTVPDETLYLFPYEHGTRHRITQGWGGKFSHQGQNEYAVDFDFDESTKVFAARSGVVVSIKTDAQIGGVNRSYKNDANYILIRHSDDTFGNYAHLQYQGALVEVGDEVHTSQLIGYSGNTGFSTGSHLHFDVRIPDISGTMMSIPFNFMDKKGDAITPQSGKTYYSYFSGGEMFVEINAEDIQKEDYANYRKVLEKDFPNKKLELRQEIIDDIVIVFISNGNEQAIKAKVTLILTNLFIIDADNLTENTIAIDIPARTELFFGILRIKDISTPIGIQSRMQYYFIE